MSLGTFRLAFSGFCMVLVLIATSLLGVDLFKTTAVVGFILGAMSLGDIVFLKLYMSQNKDLFKSLQEGDKDGTSGNAE